MSSIRKSLNLDNLSEKTAQFRASLKGKDRLGAEGIQRTTDETKKFSSIKKVFKKAEPSTKPI